MDYGAVLKFDNYGFAILSESDTNSESEVQDQDERCHIYRYMDVSELQRSTCLYWSNYRSHVVFLVSIPVLYHSQTPQLSSGRHSVLNPVLLT